MLYRVVARIWDPIWLTVFLLWFFSVLKVTYLYIYYAIICRVKYVACANVLKPTFSYTNVNNYQ